MNLWSVEHFFVGLLLLCCRTHPKVMTKMTKKSSTDQRVIRKRNTTYKILKFFREKIPFKIILWRRFLIQENFLFCGKCSFEIIFLSRRFKLSLSSSHFSNWFHNLRLIAFRKPIPKQIVHLCIEAFMPKFHERPSVLVCFLQSYVIKCPP